MFARRLWWYATLLAGLAIVIIVRLADIQVVHAADYERLATRILTRPVRYVYPSRGGIYDRADRPLATDQATADISVHYAVLTGRADYLNAVARELRRRGEYPPRTSLRKIAQALDAEVQQMWTRLSEIAGVPLDELRARAQAAVARVQRIRESVLRRSPTVQLIAEENELLPLIEDIDEDTALRVRLELESRPWIRVVPGAARVRHDDDALVHVLGRVGAASRERIDADPLRGADELLRLRPGDRCGISGVELLADPALRGRRGRVVEDYERDQIERLDPIPGRDLRLTVDLELQKKALTALEEAVRDCVHPAGASAVVIDVATGEVLVLASYPTYAYDSFNTEFDALVSDTRRLPLLFRGVAAQYPPGSTCKAITLIGAVSENVVTPEERFHCTGHLLANNTSAFRCWIYNQNPGVTHDMVDNPAGQNAEDAIRNSCNIYFFHCGERLGPERLCAWFDRLGLGRTQGTGLIEESRGVNPNQDWLINNANRTHQAADAWNFAIGQGEVTCTPLQAANVAAAVARGQWRGVRIIRDEAGRSLQPVVPDGERLDERALRALRVGMWRVVNETGGTAHGARLGNSDVELCGKTGSAQASPRVVSWRYTVEWPDGRREEVVAASRDECLAHYGDGEPPRIVAARVAERYPALHEGERLPSHAWFIGYTQPAAARRGEAPRERCYAIGVVIEFGGSGGRVAGPVARRIIEDVLAETR